ncbi:MAG: acyclic terpene utilization AtuA family protein [Robiginitomaculum sp.]|nr:acyclic terpene utilization AtuA family protein [Robiginitomaculum sp.]MDQ7076682.1 acyclic terpene utilization AtuA family protein [Robiginitomaculum sp.]
MTPRPKSIRIGGASGYWGESAMATPQFLREGGLDYIVYDYLAEITMSIMARAKAKSPDGGYATDFVSAVLKPNLPDISSAGVKIISNAGGINPTACGAAVRDLIAKARLDLKVAVITGDDLMAQKDAITTRAPDEMFTNDAFPEPEKIASINAYLGAFPIAAALEAGADIVITGRCVDSAVTLGACIHAFGWTATDYDLLASGSLAGHILECGPQATGGNFTDWDQVPDIANIGYPIARITPDGAFHVTKAKGTGGLVSVGTVSEQLIYEIGDPQAYMLPDVVCDFSGVRVHQESANCVSVSPAKGYAPPDTYKTSLTWADGFRAGLMMSYYGFDADKKARAMAKAAFVRTNAILRKFNLGDFTETSVEVIGAESQFGDYAAVDAPREVVLKIAARHPDAMGVGLLLKESVGLGLASPPGLSGFAGGRPKPSPVVRLFSYLTPKADINIQIDIDGQVQTFADKTDTAFDAASIIRPAPPALPQNTEAMTEVPLIKLAFGRSGDKGDKANIGIIAREATFMPYIWAALDEAAVAARFAHFIHGKNKAACVERFYMPGLPGINFLIDYVLGGGGMASIRNDPQGKGYAQILLAHPVSIPHTLAKTLT